MEEINHDGCARCKYEKLGGGNIPCRLCQGTVSVFSVYYDVAPDLYEPAEEVHKQLKLPEKINRPEFERQLESYSMESFINQFKYLACKVNEIITYLEDSQVIDKNEKSGDADA